MLRAERIGDCLKETDGEGEVRNEEDNVVVRIRIRVRAGDPCGLRNSLLMSRVLERSTL